MKVRPSTRSDIATFKDFWDSAVDYQKAEGLPLWPCFPQRMIEDEIGNGLHFSVDFPDGGLAGYFSMALRDELIWGDEERGDAIYIHRMCVNPARKGSNLSRLVLAWALGHVPRLGRRFVRMDTWGDNKRLVDYYVACGFCHIGDRQLDEAPLLPSHYKNTRLALFQNAAGSPPGSGRGRA